MAFKVGDQVVFGVIRGGLHHGSAVFNYQCLIEPDHKGQIVLIEGRVTNVVPATDFAVEFVFEDNHRFVWYFPENVPPTNPATPDQIAMWWPRLKDGSPAQIAPAPTPAWTEQMGVNRKMELPDSVLAQMIDRGERGVRRTLRFWPDGQRLVYRQQRIGGDVEDTVQIQWFWETEQT